MSEIITLGIGKAGVKISESFLNKIAQQHNIGSEQQRGNANVFFHDSQKNNQSRSIFIDQTQTIDAVSAIKRKSLLIKQNNLISIKGQPLNGTFAQSMYHLNDYVDQLLQKVRKQAQACDKLSGFILVDTFSGGVGSGLSSKILSKLTEQSFYGNIFQQYSIIPERGPLCSPLYIYNSVLSVTYKIYWANINMCLQNQACYQRLRECEFDLHPSIERVNDVLAQNICQATVPFRFEGSLNTNPRKLCQNMVMFPRLHFYCSSHSSITTKGQNYVENALSIKNFMIKDLFNKNNRRQDFFTCHVHCRDTFAYQEQIFKSVQKWKQKQNIKNKVWIPNSIHASISKSINGQKKASALIGTNQLGLVFSQWIKAFNSLYDRKAFLHYYINDNSLDQMEFNQAKQTILDLVSQYSMYQNQLDDDQDDSVYQQLVVEE